MSNETTERMREIQNVMAQYSIVAKYIKELETMHATERFNREQLESALTAERARADRLERAFNIYGTHKTECNVPMGDCSCGFDTALAAHQQARGE